MTKLRHPTISFNFNTPGEVFEVPDENVGYLVDTYGCEVVNVEEDIPDPTPESTPNPDNFAISKGGGWYEYQGRSYRFSRLPPAAIVLEE